MSRQNPSPAASLAAGSLAGGLEAFATYPFEFLKTRAQLRQVGGQAVSPITALRQVVANGGIRAVYTGCPSLVTGCMAKAGVRFLAFDTIKNALCDSTGRLSTGRGVLAGLAAGVLESLIAVTPTERLKTALIDDAKGPRRFKGTLHAISTIFREGGIRELYRGLVSTTLKQGSTSAVRMGSYNALKELRKSYKVREHPATTFVTGALAGVITVYTTQPLDTIKTRAQSAKGASPSQAVMSVIRDSGIRGFWQGSTMRLGRLIFSGGIIFTVYEKTLDLVYLHPVDSYRRGSQPL